MLIVLTNSRRLTSRALGRASFWRSLVLGGVALLGAPACRKSVEGHGAPSASTSTLTAPLGSAARGKDRNSITDMLGPDPGRCVEDVVVSGGCICFRLNRGGFWCRGARVFDEPPYRFIPHNYRKLFLDGPYCGQRDDGNIECWGLNRKLTPYSDEMLINSPDGLVRSPRPLTATPGPVDAFSGPGGSSYCTLKGGQVECPTFLGPEKVIEGLGEVRWMQSGPDIGCAANERQLWCWGSIVTPRLTFKKAVPVVLPAGVQIRELHFSAYSGCIVSTDSAAYCFGGGATGIWGDGQHQDCSHECKGGLTGHFVAKMGHEISQLALAGGTACALKKDGTVWCWGDNMAKVVATQQNLVPLGSTELAIEAQPVRRGELARTIPRS